MNIEFSGNLSNFQAVFFFASLFFYQLFLENNSKEWLIFSHSAVWLNKRGKWPTLRYLNDNFKFDPLKSLFNNWWLKLFPKGNQNILNLLVDSFRPSIFIIVAKAFSIYHPLPNKSINSNHSIIYSQKKKSSNFFIIRENISSSISRGISIYPAVKRQTFMNETLSPTLVHHNLIEYFVMDPSIFAVKTTLAQMISIKN